MAKSSVTTGLTLSNNSIPLLLILPKFARALPKPDVADALTPTISPTVSLSYQVASKLSLLSNILKSTPNSVSFFWNGVISDTI